MIDRNKLRRLRILQRLSQIAPSPMGEVALLTTLRADTELAPTLTLVRQSMQYLCDHGLINIISIPGIEWKAGYIAENGRKWLTQSEEDNELDIYSPDYLPKPTSNRRGRVSSIDVMPADGKAWLDQELVNRNFTGISDVTDELESKGWDIPRSTVGRYSLKLKKRIAKYKEKAEVIRSLSDIFEDDAPAIMQGAMGSALTAVMDAIEDGQYASDKESLSKLAAVLPKLGAGFKQAEQHKIEQQARKQALHDAAIAVEKTAVSQGMTRKAIDTIKRDILGIS